MQKIRLSILLFFVFLASDAFTCQVVFVRHAETKYNLTGRGKYYSKGLTSEKWLRESGYQDKKDKLLDTRPGVDQVHELTEALDGISFDKIIVSPIKRTRLTALDHLLENNLKASVWPEFRECCYGRPKGSLKRGGPVEKFSNAYLPYINEVRRVSSIEQAKSVFVYDREIDKIAFTNVEGGEGNKLVGLAVDRVKSECAPGKKILIVGHSMHGARFIRRLTGKAIRVHNTGAYLLTQLPDGGFSLKGPRSPTLQGNLEVLEELND